MSGPGGQDWRGGRGRGFVGAGRGDWSMGRGGGGAMWVSGVGFQCPPPLPNQPINQQLQIFKAINNFRMGLAMGEGDHLCQSREG
jgi:hypothetical protein